MRSETDLRPALRRAAARVDVSAPPVERMADRGRRRSRLRAAGAAASVVMLLAGAWSVGTIATRPEEVRRAAPRPEEVRSPAPEPLAARGTDGNEFVDSDALTTGTQSTTLSSGRSAAAPADEGPPLQAGPKIVKTAEIALEVERGTFQDLFARAQRLAASHGGFVAEASVDGEKARSGDLVIRVPSAAFEDTLADLKDLGLLDKESVKGSDVTAKFVDLKAHLRNWELQERAVQRLMGEANSIGQTLRLQRELQGIRLEIEKIKGNLRVLRDQTSLGTISLAMREIGTGPRPEPEERGTLGKAWDDAVAAAGDVVATMVVGAGYLAPLLALLLLAWLAFRLIRPRAAA